MDISAILDNLRPVARVFSFLGRILIFPLRLASIPVSYLLSALRIVFAPAIYLVAYMASWCRAVLDFILALQLATAAAVGVFAGFTLATSSTVITSYLGMQDSGSTAQGPRSRASQGKKPLSSLSTPTLKDDSSSNEGEWYWPDPSPSRRHVATGLLSQTILEEEDDSDI
ncbi:uncharacterized protein Triagg1_6879 [Trichoderma aggressivum f. europaeum]|uniref:Uncharacterized protein n=1 Tax=Trichoderma aggressivum f. europaeum TaxID=173218 RepID=A0AAE1M3H5_9HYPO|nr:hypothetical protein Triagg1_6879 [Trichoderma aggressivum f. europaeum]